DVGLDLEAQPDRLRSRRVAAMVDDVHQHFLEAERQPIDLGLRHAVLLAHRLEPLRGAARFVRIGADRDLVGGHASALAGFRYGSESACDTALLVTWPSCTLRPANKCGSRDRARKPCWASASTYG